jgi:ribosome-associated protein
MLRITSTITIDENEIHEEFIRSSGPGGQNVNKVATAVQLRFDVGKSRSLPDDVRKRLVRLAGRRINQDGILIIDAHRFRTQERNRQDAIDRLVELIRKAAEKPRIRRKTKPPIASKIRRLEAKRRIGKTKCMRRPVLRSAKKGADEIFD